MGCFPSRKPLIINNLTYHSKPVNSYNSNLRNNNQENKEDMISAMNNNLNKLTTSKMYSENIKIKNYITKNDSKVEDNYRILNKLGKGSFGSVFKVLHITTGIIRAMKVIKKDSLSYQDDDQKFLKEIEILIETDHPNIIRIYEYYFDDLNFYLITEFVSGGELYDTITSWKSFDEEKAAYIINQILSAVNYLHKKNIVHRDIKPENMLVENKIKVGKEKKELINIKLIDFGTCNYITEKNLTLKVGSPYYIAPEVLRRSYNEKCDIWSCGVILYILLVGYPPFSGINTNDLLSNVARGHYSMKSQEWTKVSPEAKDLVTQMLEINPSKRINAEICLAHIWLKKSQNFSLNNVDQKYFQSVLKNIFEFNAREKLQQATIAYIVHFVFNSKEIEDLKKVFRKLDQNGDGRLTYLELKNGLDNYFGKYKTEVDLNKIIQEIDGDNDGWISYEEFLRVSINQEQLLDEKNLKMAFDRFDIDKDGKLSKDEIRKVLGTADNEYINILINYIDDNNDGFINFEEFKNLMNGVVAKNHNDHDGIRVLDKQMHFSNKEKNNSNKDSFVENAKNINFKRVSKEISKINTNHNSNININSNNSQFPDGTGTPDINIRKNTTNSYSKIELKISNKKIDEQKEIFESHVSSSDSSLESK